MANEIVVNQTLKVLKSGKGFLHNPGNQVINMTGARVGRKIVNISSGAANGTLLDLTPAVGVMWGYFMNMDAVNFVTVGVRDAGGTYIPFAKVMPGKSFTFPAATDALYAKADTAACDCEHGFAEV